MISPPVISSMTSRQRVLAALRREPVDRTPVCNPTSIATVELMDLVDAPFPDANRKPELMARLAATGYTELGFDTIMPKTLATATVDRLLHHAHLVLTKGDSHRLAEALAGKGVIPLTT